MSDPTLLTLLASLPVPDATWEPSEPQMRKQHHPSGILRNVPGARMLAGGDVAEAPTSERSPRATQRSTAPKRH